MRSNKIKNWATGVVDLKSKRNSKIRVPWKQPQYATLLDKVSSFSVILLYLAKYFCKHKIVLQYITANMEV